MSDFPEPGPRSRSTSLASVAPTLGRTTPRATSRRSAPPTPSPSPLEAVEATFDVVKASEGENPWGERKARRHANAVHEKDERRFDTTALHFDQHGRLMSHADYLAHCEKYDYAWRSISKGDRVLDVGCGTDAALMRAINFVQGMAAKVLTREGGAYVGVDLNKLKPTAISWATLVGEVDMTSDDGYRTALQAVNPGLDIDGNDDDIRGYSLIVCLEVIEHMGVEDGRKLLENMRDLLSDDGRIILSTPVYDGKGQARNHIHEYYIPELQELVEGVGLAVKRRMGTFTSEPVIKKWMKENRPDWYALYMESREFHSAGYLSGVIAPMVPDLSRNNVWVLTRAEEVG